jgi:hypothetical protein
LAVDLVPWLTADHSDMVSRVVRHCHSVTVLAYRDSAAAILAQSDGMLGLCETAEVPYRIGVETQKPTSAIPANTTFGDDGEAKMAGELSAVATRMRPPLFDGFAVHHFDSWRSMRS